MPANLHLAIERQVCLEYVLHYLECGALCFLFEEEHLVNVVACSPGIAEVTPSGHDNVFDAVGGKCNALLPPVPEFFRDLGSFNSHDHESLFHVVEQSVQRTQQAEHIS